MMVYSLRSKSLAALVVALGAAWAPTAGHAQDIPTGAWKGSLGQAQVMVCFSEYRQAQYYYLRHRQNIPLTAPQAANDPGDNPQAIAQPGGRGSTGWTNSQQARMARAASVAAGS